MSKITVLASSVALDRFKSKDIFLHGFPLVESSRLSAVCRAWMQSNIKWNPPNNVPAEVQEGTEEDLWKWLWEHTSIRATELASAAGLTVPSIAILMSQLKKMKLIYPDGTVAQSILKVMGIRMQQVLSKGLKQPKPEKEKKKKSKDGEKGKKVLLQ